jgi:hypothetical protein
MVKFRFKLTAVLLLWKNNIADFTVNVQENSDPGHPDDCMLVTDNNDDYPLESLKAGMSEKLKHHIQLVYPLESLKK